MISSKDKPIGECIVKSTRSRGQARGLYIKRYGPIPRETQVCHACDNHFCLNEDHWFLGTQKENMQDMLSKGRQNFVGVPGHRNGAKLSVDQIREIRKSKETHTTLGRKFKVSRQIIYYVRAGFTYKDVGLD